MTTTIEPGNAPPAMYEDVADLNFDEIRKRAWLAANHWEALALAAWRGDAKTILFHLFQARVETYDVVKICKSLEGKVVS